MKLKIIGDSILHLHFKNKEELCSTFCRIQEHYESPEFKGKIFTLGQFREWYSKEYGAWTYNQDWSGFNVPDYAFEPFIKGLFDPLTDKEKKLIELIRYKSGKYYVIGTSKNSDSDALKHELLHAKFYVDDEYRQKITTLITNAYLVGDLKDLKSHILDLGYSESVMLDECHAYLGASSDYLIKEGIDCPEHLIKAINEFYNTK